MKHQNQTDEGHYNKFKQQNIILQIKICKNNKLKN